MSNGSLQNQKGVTLIELVITIVVVGIAVAGILAVFTLTTGKSADPMVQRQAIAVAEAYLEEILAKPFSDPDGVSGETDRDLFDDVLDYDGLTDSPPQNQSGVNVAGLNDYRVNVLVVTGANLGNPAVNAHRVVVRVTHPANGTVELVGFRADY